jgi:hypothetical protein
MVASVVAQQIYCFTFRFRWVWRREGDNDSFLLSERINDSHKVRPLETAGGKGGRASVSH